MRAMVRANAGALALAHASSQAMFVRAFLGRCIRTVLVTEHLTDVLNVIIVFEALFAAFLANIFVASGAFGRIASGSEFRTCHLLRNGLGIFCDIQLFHGIFCDIIQLVHHGCIVKRALQSRGTLVNTTLQMMATRWRQCSAIPLLAILIWHTLFASWSAGSPVSVLHETSVCDDLATFAFVATFGAIFLTMLEVFFVIMCSATLQARVKRTSAVNHDLGALLEKEILSEDLTRREQSKCEPDHLCTKSGNNYWG